MGLKKEAIPMKCYKYRPMRKIFSIWPGIGVGVIMAMIGILVGGRAIYLQVIGKEEFNPMVAMIGLGFIMVSLVTFIFVLNFQPDICLNEDCLYIQFFLTRQEARLEDIVAIKRVKTPFRGQDFIILFRKGLTPFHRIYGLAYGSNFYPGVYVSGSISDRDELEKVLNDHV